MLSFPFRLCPVIEIWSRLICGTWCAISSNLKRDLMLSWLDKKTYPSITRDVTHARCLMVFQDAFGYAAANSGLTSKVSHALTEELSCKSEMLR